MFLVMLSIIRIPLFNFVRLSIRLGVVAINVTDRILSPRNFFTSPAAFGPLGA